MKYGHALFGEEVVIRKKQCGSYYWVNSPSIIGHIPFASLEGDKRPGKINQNQESLNILCPKQENNVSILENPR